MSTLSELIPTLLEKTNEGKIEWQQLSAATFVARVGAASLEVGRNRNNVDYLVLRNEVGDALEQTDYNLLPSGLDQQLRALYERAHRKALRLDETIEDLKKRLKEL